MNAKRLILALGMVGVFWGAGCSDIPSNTPLLLEKTCDRIETRSAVVTRTLRTVLDEAAFTQADIAEVKSELAKIDPSALAAEDQKMLQDGIRKLGEVEQALGALAKYGSVPPETERIFGETVKGLEIVHEIISAEIDKKALVQNMIDIIGGSEGEEK